MPKMYGWVREVVPDSPADRAGIQAGDLIRAINGQPVRDMIDYRFLAADDTLHIDLTRRDEPLALELRKDPDDDLGVLFGEEPAPFIRICANKCVFCFIKGLPDRHAPQRGLPLGMRASLYIKDDDYRYSFMFGNFITLTNLKEHDWQRLAEQRLSPLYVSVHVTDPDLRRVMVDGPRSGEIMAHLQRLGELNIRAHTQLVLCPGINDGAYLDRSIADLAALRPTVASISAVPVGLTKFNNMLKVGDLPALQPYRRDEAEAVVAQVTAWQKRLEAEIGEPFIYLSDEWYYLTEQPFPRATHYRGYAQLENGVGMTRKLLDEWARLRRKLPPSVPEETHITLVTATMAQPIMTRLAADLNTVANLHVDLLPVTNAFFGPLVTVAGLLCGQDILDALASFHAARPVAGRRLILLPRIVLDNSGRQFLDDLAVADFQQHAGHPVIFAQDMSEVVELAHALAASALPDVLVLVGGN
jgi:putative radical SAM enzyme (TIGR03279 family)